MGQIIHNPDLISYNAVAILKIINEFARIMHIEKPVTKHPPICLLALCEEDQEAVAPKFHHGAHQTSCPYGPWKPAPMSAACNTWGNTLGKEQQRRRFIDAIVRILTFVNRRLIAFFTIAFFTWKRECWQHVVVQHFCL